MATVFCQSSLVPVFSLYESVKLISHLPLVSANVQNQVASLLKPVNDMVRFIFLFQGGIDRELNEIFQIEQDGKHLNASFDKYDYSNGLFLPNTIASIAALSCVIIVAILVICADFVYDRLYRSRQEARNKVNAQVKNALLCFSLLLFFELLLCSWLHFKSLKDYDFDGRATESTWSALGALVVDLYLLVSTLKQTFPRKSTA